MFGYGTLSLKVESFCSFKHRNVKGGGKGKNNNDIYDNVAAVGVAWRTMSRA